MKNIRLIATDLDGTFLRNDRTISPANLEALNRLGEKNIVRVVATGRNLRKVREVISSETPFDFVVFSSGAGVYNWSGQQHVYRQNIGIGSAQKLIRFLMGRNINFHAFFPVPENHRHWFYRGSEKCEEFERYFQFNQAYAIELSENNFPVSELCQFLIIIRENKDHFRILKEEIEKVSDEIRVIRASSPITGGYIWAEVFHKSVSKGNGVNKICQLLDISAKETIGIGNDYNDLDLLDFTHHSFLTENAPHEIRNGFTLTPSNENDGFAHAVQHILE